MTASCSIEMIYDLTEYLYLDIPAHNPSSASRNTISILCISRVVKD